MKLLAPVLLGGLLLSAQTPYDDGLRQYQAGRPGEAIGPLRQALKANPALTSARLLLGASLAETGRCQEALDLLKGSGNANFEAGTKRSIGFARVRCAMSLNRVDEASDAMRTLSAQFPRDPDVLFLAVHVYSDLSIRASQTLLYTAPGSYQVRQLNAEALETQGKWTEAAEEYRLVLTQNPRLPGIHYRLGRLILSQPKTDTTMEDARREFEAELHINPNNAGAHYILGEIARQADQWPQAVEHFGAAAKLDAGFADAFIGLGRSLMSTGKIAEAIPPLETATKLQPPNPVPHYYLAIAYRRSGRKAEADREAALHKQANERVRQTQQEIQLSILGPQRVDLKEQERTP